MAALGEMWAVLHLPGPLPPEAADAVRGVGAALKEMGDGLGFAEAPGGAAASGGVGGRSVSFEAFTRMLTRSRARGRGLRRRASLEMEELLLLNHFDGSVVGVHEDQAPDKCEVAIVQVRRLRSPPRLSLLLPCPACVRVRAFLAPAVAAR